MNSKKVVSILVALLMSGLMVASAQTPKMGKKPMGKMSKMSKKPAGKMGKMTKKPAGKMGKMSKKPMGKMKKS
jgi:hypothetical protein